MNTKKTDFVLYNLPVCMCVIFGDLMHTGHVKEEAFLLYYLDVPVEHISTKLEVGRKTIYRWIDMFGWKERKQQLLVFVKENGSNDTDFNSKLIKTVKSIWFKSVEDETVKVSTRDVIEILKFEEAHRIEDNSRSSLDFFKQFAEAYKIVKAERKAKELNSCENSGTELVGGTVIQ